MKKFKLNAEGFRQKFVQHQRNPEKSWKDFIYEVTNYFQGWISALNVTDLEGLKDLIITDQVKKRVPQEIRDHFVDVWGTLVKPQDLADKLDEYECIRKTYRRPSNPNPKAHPQVNVRNNAFSRDNRDYNNSPKQMKQDKGFTRNRYEPKNRPKFTCYFCGVDGHVKKFCPKLLKTNSDQDSRRKANVHRTVVDPEPVTKETAVVAKVMSHRRPSLDKGLCNLEKMRISDTEPKTIKDREIVDETSDDNPVLGSEEIRALSVENSEKNAKEQSRSDEFLKDQVDCPDLEYARKCVNEKSGGTKKSCSSMTMEILSKSSDSNTSLETVTETSCVEYCLPKSLHICNIPENRTCCPDLECCCQDKSNTISSTFLNSDVSEENLTSTDVSVVGSQQIITPNGQFSKPPIHNLDFKEDLVSHPCTDCHVTVLNEIAEQEMRDQEYISLMLQVPHLSLPKNQLNAKQMEASSEATLVWR
ncbi:hypothetical protein HNY73_021967 [Argiope bruennichi]|uniref:CCHC-type domain-containing protein n=1 Tax=Argiope bruennichi TaxID=94029 RepID=A0A8T0DZD1_ARGBR|nr:hypothetical protein HNY73_021967 [Argiope bruennichi]